MEATAGLEPANEGFAGPCLTTWLRRLYIHYVVLTGEQDTFYTAPCQPRLSQAFPILFSYYIFRRFPTPHQLERGEPHAAVPGSGAGDQSPRLQH